MSRVVSDIHYDSISGRKYRYIRTFDSVYIFINIDNDRTCGVFIVPWFYTDDMVKDIIEYWDENCYPQIDWDKVVGEAELNEEDLS